MKSKQQEQKDLRRQRAWIPDFNTFEKHGVIVVCTYTAHDLVDAGYVRRVGLDYVLSLDGISKQSGAYIRAALTSGYIPGNSSTHALFRIVMNAVGDEERSYGTITSASWIRDKLFRRLQPTNIPREKLELLHKITKVYIETIDEGVYADFREKFRRDVRTESLTWLERYHAHIGGPPIKEKPGRYSPHSLPVPKKIFTAPTKIPEEFHTAGFGRAGEIIQSLLEGESIPIKVSIGR